MVNHTRHKNNYARFLEVNGNRPQTTKEHLYDGLYKQEFKDAIGQKPAATETRLPTMQAVAEPANLGTKADMEELKNSALPVEGNPAAEADEPAEKPVEKKTGYQAKGKK